MSTSVHDNLLDNHDISIKTAIFIENEKVAVAFTLTSTLRCPHCWAILKGHGKHYRTLKSISSKNIVVLLPRVRCDNSDCGKVKESHAKVRPCITFVIYPASIAPFKRYSLLHLLILIKLASQNKLTSKPFYLNEQQLELANNSLNYVRNRLSTLVRNFRVTVTSDQKFFYISTFTWREILTNTYLIRC